MGGKEPWVDVMADGAANVLKLPEPGETAALRVVSKSPSPIARSASHRPSTTATRSQVLRFDRFQCLPYQRQLLDGDTPVNLGSRAFDILVVLLDRHGDLVGKDELIAAVWPDTHVEESNLRVHMMALRKALGDDDEGRFIRTIPGRGYRFIAPVERHDLPQPSVVTVPPQAPPPSNLPVSLARIFGRADIVRALAAQLLQRRFITIVGPGGIGKTTVALKTAESLAKSYPDGVCFIDLAPIADAPQLAACLAAALGLGADREPDDVVRGLADKRMLIVIDNCEHLVAATAELIERVSRAAPHVHILVTSREPLRHTAEWVRRLPPLRCPPPCERLTADEAMTYPAVQLFVDRMSASDDLCEIDDDNAGTVADICRRLDGMPLAIELAASRVQAFGLKELAAQLAEPLRLLSAGRRTADARHQTLAGMLDWSYQTLSEPECIVLRRLAIFPDEFTLAAACAIAELDSSADVVEGIAGLVSKSLVMADVSHEATRYRLFATTRTYALVKLAASGELETVARRHVEHVSGAGAVPNP
jgi:predicted ATPase/DNA-binding winged helix-turn-helix (wHTH) protein